MIFCPQAAQRGDVDDVALSWLQVPAEEEGGQEEVSAGARGGHLSPPPTRQAHRKVYLATLLFSSTVRSSRSPGWRMETRTLLTVECLSRWRAHCTVMVLAVTFVISKPSTGRGPGRSEQRSGEGHGQQPAVAAAPSLPAPRLLCPTLPIHVSLPGTTTGLAPAP